MECSLQWGTVRKVRDRGKRQELVVERNHREVPALNYLELTGPCQIGDQVLLNTTASELNLGTGGWHYVLAVWGRERSLFKTGHIMKLRYTPLQGRVLSVEEEASPHHQTMAAADDLSGLPVAVGSLHSMLAPFAFAFKSFYPLRRLVYLMSDGAALPLAFSETAALLREQGLLQTVITFGHAFGGDLEAVNIYSALLAAKHVAQADAAVVLMGPGVVGTKTKWGTTALEQGLFLNATVHLGGLPRAIPRLSEADPRERHRGFSHHSITVLKRIVLSPIQLRLPLYLRAFPRAVQEIAGLRHKISWQNTTSIYKELLSSQLPLSTMGRGPQEDPLFFHGVLAAASEILPQP